MLGFLILIWAALLALLVVGAIGRVHEGGALTLTYFVGASLLHVPGALAFLGPVPIIAHWGLGDAYATEHGFTVVTKDTDFHQHSFVFGTPPKVIWIRLGNCPTRMVAELIRLHKAKIEEFAKNDDWVFLELR